MGSNVTIDGSASGTNRDLTIENTSSDYPAVLFSQLARGNTIKNSIVKAKGNKPGVICIGLPDTTNQYDTSIDSINIINCEITGTSGYRPYSGIYFNVDYWLTHDASGMVVRNCDIHDCSAGIYNNWKLFSPVFEGNNIYSTSTAGNFRNYTYGIYIKSEALNLSINKNKIFDLSNNISGSNVVGIYSTNSRVAQTDTIENNIISLGSTFNNNNCTVTGIKISDSSVTSPDTWFIFGNSVKINGSSITSGLSSCFIKSGTSNINSKNNVFYNSRSGGTDKHYAIYVSNAAGTEVFDFNDYFTDGTNGMLGYWLNTDLNNLSSWRNTTYQDSFSVSGNPGFTSETNLQPDISNQYCWNLNGKGVQIPSLNYDINGITRSTTITNGAPDIGAYEFTPSCNPVPAAESGTKTDGGTTTYNIAGNAIASITWHGADLPAVQVFYYSGANPLNTIPGSKFGNYYLDIVPAGGSNFTYDLKIFYTHPLAGTITAENNIRIAKTNETGNWGQYESILNTSGHYTEVTGLNSFSHFTIADNNSPLPVSISSFTSSINKRDVTLTWVTLFENNNSGFEIQRSEDRTNWNKIGYLAGARNGKHTGKL